MHDLGLSCSKLVLIIDITGNTQTRKVVLDKEILDQAEVLNERDIGSLKQDFEWKLEVGGVRFFINFSMQPVGLREIILQLSVTQE